MIVGIVLLSHNSVLADLCGDELLKALKGGLHEKKSESLHHSDFVWTLLFNCIS